MEDPKGCVLSFLCYIYLGILISPKNTKYESSKQAIVFYNLQSSFLLMYNCNNYIYVYLRTLSEQLETIDVKMIAEEIYHKLCSTYQFPDSVSNNKVFTFNT